jgi:hypothetical protein
MRRTAKPAFVCRNKPLLARFAHRLALYVPYGLSRRLCWWGNRRIQAARLEEK